MNKIGIFFGSFDPVHAGHIYIASETKCMMHLDQVLLIPINHAPHKSKITATFKQRIDMCDLAVKNNRGIEVSDIEKHRLSAGYSMEILDLLMTEYRGNSFYYIMGSDVFLSILSWHNLSELVEKVSFIIAIRTKDQTDRVMEIKRTLELMGGQVNTCLLDEMKCSSTQLKEVLRNGQYKNPFIDESVMQYIHDHNIY